MADPYQHKPFPKMVYFENGSHRIVQNEDELGEAKKDGARESPADFTKDTDVRASAQAKADADKSKK